MMKYSDRPNAYINAKDLEIAIVKATSYGDALDAVREAPSIDIVRCGECKKLRDCRHDSWQKGVIEMGYAGWCERTSRLGDVTYVKDSDFCNHGERKSDGS